MRKPLVIVPVIVPVIVLALSACSPAKADNAVDGVLRIVASTNVYGELAAEIGGPDVEITSIIDDPDQDPHEFEANGRVQLALSRADIVIVNGGGYDDFATRLLEGSGNDAARVLDAVDLSGYDAAQDGFNEHVFYDYPTMQTLAKAIGAALDIADPSNTDLYDRNVETVVAQLSALEQLEASIGTVAQGAGVIITEPVPLYVLDAAGLRNLTPPEFSEAIEEDTDVPPALLQRVLTEIGRPHTAAVVYNSQTGGPQTDAVLDAARQAGVPAIAVTETIPADTSYFDWQVGFLTDLQVALAR